MKMYLSYQKVGDFPASRCKFLGGGYLLWLPSSQRFSFGDVRFVSTAEPFDHTLKENQQRSTSKNPCPLRKQENSSSNQQTKTPKLRFDVHTPSVLSTCPVVGTLFNLRSGGGGGPTGVKLGMLFSKEKGWWTPHPSFTLIQGNSS